MSEQGRPLIVVVGCGNIGFRHVQALLSEKNHYDILAYDPDVAGLNAAEFALLNQDKFASKILKTTTEFPRNMDISLAIIATNADVRFAVTESLIQQNTVKSIVFEKVLFQSKVEVDKMSSLLNQQSISAWVNCPRRMMPCYKKVKERINPQQPIKMELFGKNVGMACNAIHFLDLFFYLGNINPVNLDFQTNLDDRLLKAKRSGFYELTGEIYLECDKHSIHINCDDDGGKEEIKIKIENSGAEFQIDEINSDILTVIDNESIKSDFILPFQSQMSQKFSLGIIKHDKCELPSFDESAKLHVAMIEAFLPQFNRLLHQSNDFIPIT
ncbi:Gfo/Idh/MocA family oxidoreductase [Aestuariibacter sp. AA17]|uniref:Gfo/Idh/MocA family oxidoreductase n=1 Tax=Fluctibacter corallii TaxID=2984329 RepID=A0ABT3A9Z4_9ALTE|nr:Gfo/Idh/MocA family oxidoreductase [Aestuariibacter sp. AA17]MCV2885448.1 Gfo/Idh/MocA family oxidoreductase [Aestuariibacter sp. AA17]